MSGARAQMEEGWKVEENRVAGKPNRFGAQTCGYLPVPAQSVLKGMDNGSSMRKEQLRKIPTVLIQETGLERRHP
jgi:hypothetical protein